MKTLLMILKIILNIILFGFYSLLGIITGNFFFGLMLTVFGKTVPGSYDPIHEKIAVLSIVSILILTLLLRKYFYLKVDCSFDATVKNKKQELKTEKKKEDFIENKTEDDLEIYVNKEIKK